MKVVVVQDGIGCGHTQPMRYDEPLRQFTRERNNEHTVTHIKGHFEIYFTRKQNEKRFNCLDECLKHILAWYQIRHSVDDDDAQLRHWFIHSFIVRLFVRVCVIIWGNWIFSFAIILLTILSGLNCSISRRINNEFKILQMRFSRCVCMGC